MDEQQAASLTVASLHALFDRIANESPRPHEHVVHPDALTKDGFYRCACGAIPVRNGRIDWEWGIAQLRDRSGLTSPSP